MWTVLVVGSSLIMAAAPPTVEEKPAMYTVVSSGDMPAAVSTASLVGYGSNEPLLQGSTRTVWWSGMSMAAVFTVLDKPQPVNAIYVSRFYNWHPGSVHGAYTQATSFKLKASAPDDAVALVSKNIFVPLFDKLIADGTVIEYQVDVEAEHTTSPDTFWISVITAKAEGLDKVNAAIADVFATNPMVGPTFSSAVDFAVHRDYLYRTDATYK